MVLFGLLKKYLITETIMVFQASLPALLSKIEDRKNNFSNEK